MKVPFVDLKAQYRSIKAEIDAAIADVIENTAFIGGSAVESFERDFAEFIGASHCVGVGNGTDAIFIALKSLGIGEGDEVITAANSFIATSEAITQTGARVVFCDVDDSTYNIDPELIASRITSRTKAIVPVHLYGRPADLETLGRLAREHGLKIVEDAAQAHGARIGDRKVGSFGDVACFSFYPGKNLGAYGDAGAIVTNKEELATRMRMFKNHGRSGKYDHEFEGVNSRLDGLQAAVLNVKLRHLEEWSEKRYACAVAYNDRLAGRDAVTCPQLPGPGGHVFHLYVIRTSRREELREFLGSRGIATGVHYPIALPNLNAYGYMEHEESDFPVASRLQGEVLSLPMFPELTSEQIEYVANAVRGFFER